MTPEQVKILLDNGVLQAFAEGKKIQYSWPGNPSFWIDYSKEICHPKFDSSGPLWRVKPEKKTGWVNIYQSGGCLDNGYTSAYITKELADSVAQSNRIACIQITYEEGEGL